jgi:hypothetical protein
MHQTSAIISALVLVAIAIYLVFVNWYTYVIKFRFAVLSHHPARYSVPESGHARF